MGRAEDPKHSLRERRRKGLRALEKLWEAILVEGVIGDTVVAHDGVRHHEHLTFVGWVGERFRIAHHARSEYQLARDRLLVTKRHPSEAGAIFKNEGALAVEHGAVRAEGGPDERLWPLPRRLDVRCDHRGGYPLPMVLDGTLRTRDELRRAKNRC